MISMTGQQLQHIFPQSKQPDLEFGFSGVETDSRKACSGKLFIALKGEHFDAHDYLQQAADQGAVAALVETPVAVDLPQLVVVDSLQAMAKLAHVWRHQIAAKLIAITGSNGKTTVKEMLGKILSDKAKVLLTPGNFNNAIGVPLTLFGLSPEDQYAVVEMGANHRHEIEQLVALADPDIVYVNNARPAHLQGFGSLQGVIQAKGEMYQYAPPQSLAVFNEDEEATPYWKSIACSQRRLGFSLQGEADVQVEICSQQDGLQLEVAYQQKKSRTRLQLRGRHNAQNAAAAISLAIACGVELENACAALEQFMPVQGRQQFINGLNDSQIIDDSYNANPDSLAAAIKVLCELDGEAWLALGDMAEMGDESLKLHENALYAAKHAGVKEVFALGEMSCHGVRIFNNRGHCFDSHQSMIDALTPRLHAGINLLVKGSRSARMEKIVAALRLDNKQQQRSPGGQHAI